MQNHKLISIFIYTTDRFVHFFCAFSGNLPYYSFWCNIISRCIASSRDQNRGRTELISAVNISKRYGKAVILDQVSIAVAPGEIVCIVGPNGSGKSTLLAILAGLLPADSGQVLYKGAPLRRATGHIGFVPQQDSLFPELTTADNLSFWASAAGTSLPGTLGSPALRLLGLDELLHKQVRHLSGGMRRRAAIATALVGEPSLLILDEPFTGLDLYFKEQLAALLKRLRDAGVTLLYTSHNADEIAPLSDRMHLLSGGGIVMSAKTSALSQNREELTRYLLEHIRNQAGYGNGDK